MDRKSVPCVEKCSNLRALSFPQPQFPFSFQIHMPMIHNSKGPSSSNISPNSLSKVSPALKYQSNPGKREICLLILCHAFLMPGKECPAVKTPNAFPSGLLTTTPSYSPVKTFPLRSVYKSSEIPLQEKLKNCLMGHTGKNPS